MAVTPKSIYVYAHWQGIDDPALVGTLTATPSKGKEIFAFEYAEEWLHANYSQTLDPNLQLFAGRQYAPQEKSNFGIFMDSSPDRWGKVLMRRREAILARKEDRKPTTLLESDYLLGVYDGHRMGALRFKTNIEEAFLSDEKDLASPPWASLRELEYASLRLEAEEDMKDDEAIKWLNMLMAPGASLGGARPKASIKDTKGELWIAKFPSVADDRNIGAWEMVVRELAELAGIRVSRAMLKKFSGKHHTFLSQRFDRIDEATRLHFASAMTLLGHNDGEGHQEGVSYLELAEFISTSGVNVKKELEELWRRIVFNICVKNTDDHLRNHGFILTTGGWELSPAYDMNPVPNGHGLTLNISEDDNSLDIDLALSVAQYFRIVKKDGEGIIDQVLSAVGQWRKIATKHKLSKAEQDSMEGAFRTVI